MKTKIFLPIVLTTSMLLGQSFKQESVLTINDTINFSAEEFIHVYNKNRDLAEKVDPKSINEYMDLFVNFKLKVIDAENNKLDEKPSFISEFKGYKHQISKNYLTDSYAEEKLIKEAYERMKEQVRASHILIAVAETAPAKDTLIAYNKALEVLARLEKEDFNKVAQETSEDPSVKNNNGDLGFFSTLQMVYPFENAAYNTPVGGFSKPIRTQFGYHILKVTDRRDNPGERQVAHIMLKNSTEKDDATQKKKIEEIYSKLKKKESTFNELVKTYSEDTRSIGKDGLLDWFGTGKLAKSFEENAFGLKKLNDYSKPFKTKYGWHIVKLIGKRNISTFEQEKPYISKKMSKNDRAQMADNSFIDKLKKEYNFVLYPKNVDRMSKILNTMNFVQKTSEELNNNNDYKNPIYTFADKTFTQSDLARALKQQEASFSRSKNQTSFIYSMLATIAKDQLIKHERSQLETKYPEYKLLVQEYHDGILLYEISKEKIWDKAVKDTVGLKAFYDKNQANYKYDSRLEGTVFEVPNSKVAKQVKKYLSKGKSVNYIEAKLNQSSSLNFKATTGVFSKGDNSIVDAVKWENGISEEVKKGTGIAFVKIDNILAPEVKLLKDARGLVISDYQNYLEKEWLNTLKKENKTTINTDVLDQIKKHVN